MRIAPWLAVAGILASGALATNEAAAQAPTTAAAAAEPRNSLGLAFDHVSIEVPTFDTEAQFWKTLGGAQRPMAAPAAGAGRFTFIDFPDITVTIREKSGGGGSGESVVNHIGFLVPDAVKTFASLEAAGIKAEHANANNPLQGIITSPAGVRVEIQQDAMQTVPIRGQHVHFFVPAPLEAQAWYAKVLGAIPGKRGPFDAANITSKATVMNLTFSAAPGPVLPIKGRALDHIGFSVDNLAAFMQRLQGLGVKVDQPLTIQANGHTGLAFVFDPWGTRIEFVDQHAGPQK